MRGVAVPLLGKWLQWRHESGQILGDAREVVGLDLEVPVGERVRGARCSRTRQLDGVDERVLVRSLGTADAMST